MKKIITGFTFVLLFIQFSSNIVAAEDENREINERELTEILIKGVPFQAPLKEVPSSTVVFDERSIQLAGVDNFQSLINQVPNLNFSGGTARPRFFQIRGIGELEQYEVAPNPSVGFFVDGIDLSGIGSVSSMFDVDQVEVLRGPQSIKYGANALAGIIDLHSKDPSDFNAGKLEVGFGSDDLSEGGIAIGGPVAGTDETLLFRMSSFHHYNDGFRDNDFLGRDDTNQREESTYRTKLKWIPSKDFTADLTFLSVNANNGYDVFNVDNTFTTYSDRPGQDDQDTLAGALRLNYKVTEDFSIESFSSLLDNDSHYSFDGDWGNNPYWEPFAPYDFFSETLRDRSTYSQEIKLVSNDTEYTHGESWKWALGAYFQRLAEDSNINQYQDDSIYDRLVSNYTAKTSAIFTQVEAPLRLGTSLSFGLRAEKRDTNYYDSKDADFSPENDMYGGNISLNHDLSRNVRTYALVSRGFKGGGFNANPSVPGDRKQYDPEYLWNYEMGVKGNFLEGDLQLNLSGFYDHRSNVQVKLGIQSDPSDPLTFLFLTDNAGGGNNEGLETEMLYKINQRLSLSAGASILSTEFQDFDYDGLDLSGRRQSHAPLWQYSLSPYYSFTDNVFAAATLSGKDSFYYDDSHNAQSSPYHTVNFNLGYKTASWSWTIWIRNAFDEEYATRGFFFGNEPPDFPNKEYVHLGDPRMIGTTLTLRY